MPRLVYISFDLVPAPKGASTHIEAFVGALAGAFGRVELLTPSATASQPLPEVERWPGVFHTELPAMGASLIDRVLCFRRFLDYRLRDSRPDVIHFRSIFEGFPLLRLAPRPKLVFEVNGMPSIELKYRYPGAADDRELTAKLIAQERACAVAADRIVTPSAITANFLVAARGARAAKIRVIPNGVWIPGEAARPADPARLLYFGTLSPWQGVDLAIRALAMLRPRIPLKLAILGSGSAAERDELAGLAAKLGVAEDVEILPPVERAELTRWIASSFAVLAPLPVNDRNTRQGCCPLKVLEAMAGGVPVIASDLPVVREIGEHGAELLLVKPGSVDQIAFAIERLHGDAALWQSLAARGRARVAERFTWERAGAALAAVYEELGVSRRSTV
jgi:glycosyltransferase involved in cell wall biosynthesis